VLRGIGDDGPHREDAAVGIPAMTREMDAPGLLVDMSDPKVLTGWVGIRHAARKEIARRRQAVQLQRKFGTLIPHAGQLK